MDSTTQRELQPLSKFSTPTKISSNANVEKSFVSPCLSKPKSKTSTPLFSSSSTPKTIWKRKVSNSIPNTPEVSSLTTTTKELKKCNTQPKKKETIVNCKALYVGNRIRESDTFKENKNAHESDLFPHTPPPSTQRKIPSKTKENLCSNKRKTQRKKCMTKIVPPVNISTKKTRKRRDSSKRYTPTPESTKYSGTPPLSRRSQKKIESSKSCFIKAQPYSLQNSPVMHQCCSNSIQIHNQTRENCSYSSFTQKLCLNEKNVQPKCMQYHPSHCRVFCSNKTNSGHVSHTSSPYRQKKIGYNKVQHQSPLPPRHNTPKDLYTPPTRNSSNIRIRNVYVSPSNSATSICSHSSTSSSSRNSISKRNTYVKKISTKKKQKNMNRNPIISNIECISSTQVLHSVTPIGNNCHRYNTSNVGNVEPCIEKGTPCLGKERGTTRLRNLAPFTFGQFDKENSFDRENTFDNIQSMKQLRASSAIYVTNPQKLQYNLSINTTSNVEFLKKELKSQKNENSKLLQKIAKLELQLVDEAERIHQGINSREKYDNCCKRSSTFSNILYKSPKNIWGGDSGTYNTNKIAASNTQNIWGGDCGTSNTNKIDDRNTQSDVKRDDSSQINSPALLGKHLASILNK